MTRLAIFYVSKTTRGYVLPAYCGSLKCTLAGYLHSWHRVSTTPLSQEREIAFRNTSESTNARVMWWSLVSIVLVVGSGLYQVAHLRSFFRKKKLV